MSESKPSGERVKPEGKRGYTLSPEMKAKRDAKALLANLLYESGISTPEDLKKLTPEVVEKIIAKAGTGEVVVKKRKATKTFPAEVKLPEKPAFRPEPEIEFPVEAIPGTRVGTEFIPESTLVKLPDVPPDEKIRIFFSEGEILSGYMPRSRVRELEAIGLTHDVSGWGSEFDDEAAKVLGEEFTWAEAVNYALPKLEAKEKKKPLILEPKTEIPEATEKISVGMEETDLEKAKRAYLEAMEEYEKVERFGTVRELEIAIWKKDEAMELYNLERNLKMAEKSSDAGKIDLARKALDDFKRRPKSPPPQSKKSRKMYGGAYSDISNIPGVISVDDED